jgi:hypothetical protein
VTQRRVTARVVTDWYGWSRWKSLRLLRQMEKTVSLETGKRMAWRAGRTLYTTQAGLEEYLKAKKLEATVDIEAERALLRRVAKLEVRIADQSRSMALMAQKVATSTSRVQELLERDAEAQRALRAPTLVTESQADLKSLRGKGTVYIVVADTLQMATIGMTSDMAGRLRNLAIAAPVKLRLVFARTGGTDLELAYHRRFWRVRAHGEWYLLDGVLKQFVDEVDSLANRLLAKS